MKIVDELNQLNAICQRGKLVLDWLIHLTYSAESLFIGKKSMKGIER